MKISRFTQVFLVAIISLSFCISVQAQIILNTSVMVIPEEVELSESQEDQLIETIKDVLQEYEKKATLMDANEGKVNQESLRAFKSLFANGAKVTNDLSRYTVVSNFSDYGGTVYEYLTGTGVKYSLSPGANLMELDYDEAGYYKARIIFKKTLYNGLETNNSVFTCKSGIVYAVTMNVRIEEDNLSKGAIFSINARREKECEDPYTSVGFSLEGGSDFGISNGLKTVNADDLGIGDFLENNLVLNSISTFGGGVNLLLPITKKELLSLNVGVGFHYYDLNVSVLGDKDGNQDYDFNESFEGVIECQGLETPQVNPHYIKRVDINPIDENGIIEENSIFTLQFPVGVRYAKKPKQGRDHSFMVDILAVPSYQILGTTELLNSNVRYTADWYEDSGSPINVENNKRVATLEGVKFLGFDEEANPGVGVERAGWTNTFSISARLAPGMRYTLTDNLTAEASVNFTYGITSFTTARENFGVRPLQDAGNDFVYSDEELGGSFLENYYSSVPVSTLGLRLGIVYVFK